MQPQWKCVFNAFVQLYNRSVKDTDTEKHLTGTKAVQSYPTVLPEIFAEQIFAVERNFCISEMIRASKFRG